MTNPTQWIAAALKILAIYLLVEAITAVQMYAGSRRSCRLRDAATGQQAAD